MRNASRRLAGRRGLGQGDDWFTPDFDVGYSDVPMNGGDFGSVYPNQEIPAPDSGFFGKLVTGITDISKAVMAYKTQDDINDINLERVRRGQAPISAAYLRAMQPQMGVNVGLSPQVKNLLIFGGLGLGAVYLLTRRRSR